jgi:hypothetical protein
MESESSPIVPVPPVEPAYLEQSMVTDDETPAVALITDIDVDNIDITNLANLETKMITIQQPEKKDIAKQLANLYNSSNTPRTL